jgi:hypothetical protein
MKGTPGGCTGVEFSHRRAVLGDQEHFARGRHLIHQGKAGGRVVFAAAVGVVQHHRQSP